MRKFMYILIAIAMFSINIDNVNAAYDKNKEFLNEYIEQAEKVEVKYILDEEYVSEDGNSKNGMFKIEIRGLTDDLEIRLFGSEEYYYDLEDDGIDGVIILEGIESGIKKIGVYYQQYALLKTISVNIPVYNYYSERIECQGISGEELDVCDKWYKYELNESTFLSKINKYMEEREILEEEKDKKKVFTFFSEIINFLMDYFVYIIVGVVLIVLVTLFIVFRRKKYSLE